MKRLRFDLYIDAVDDATTDEIGRALGAAGGVLAIGVASSCPAVSRGGVDLENKWVAVAIVPRGEAR